MKILRFISFLFLILLGGTMVRGQSEVCVVTKYFWDEQSKSSSSRSSVGKFPLKFEGSSILKEFRDPESGVNVYVGVEQVTDIIKNSPKRLRVAISFEGKLEEVFEELNRAEAETVYDRTWKGLSVSKSIKIESRVYTFTFGCEKIRR